MLKGEMVATRGSRHGGEGGGLGRCMTMRKSGSGGRLGGERGLAMRLPRGGAWWHVGGDQVVCCRVRRQRSTKVEEEKWSSLAMGVMCMVGSM